MKQNQTSTQFVFINTFNVEPQKQEELAQILKESTMQVISKQEGYLGNSIFKSKDGKTVIVWALWKSLRDIEATRTTPQNSEFLKRIQATGAIPHPGVYDLYFSDCPEPERGPRT